MTAYAIRGLKAFAPPGRARDMNERLARATAWLAAQKAVTTEDRNMQLLGLLWAGRGASERERLARTILAKQRADGGWAQSDDLQSDAYATGLSLFALAEAGGISSDHAAYKRGVAYLLSSQRPDGSGECEKPRGEVPAVLRRRIPLRTRSVDFVDGNRVGDGSADAGVAVGGWWLVVGRPRAIDPDDQPLVSISANRSASAAVRLAQCWRTCAAIPAAPRRSPLWRAFESSRRRSLCR